MAVLSAAECREVPAVASHQLATCSRIVAGEMAEWLKAHAWKACLLERVTWVRIPLSPPYFPRINTGDYQKFVDGVLDRGLASQVSGG
jgi:hypothetical protein